MEYGIGELPGPPATLAGAPGQPAWAAAGTPPSSSVYLQQSGVTWSNPGARSPRPPSGTRRPTSSDRVADKRTPGRASTGPFRNPLAVHSRTVGAGGRTAIGPRWVRASRPARRRGRPRPAAPVRRVRCVRSALCRRCLPGTPHPVADDPVPGLPVLAGAAYGGAVRRAVLAFKERGRRDLVGALGLVLGRTVAALVAGAPRDTTVLVTVPSSRAAAAARGGDHVLRLARRAAVVSGVRVAPRVCSSVARCRTPPGSVGSPASATCTVRCGPGHRPVVVAGPNG